MSEGWVRGTKILCCHPMHETQRLAALS